MINELAKFVVGETTTTRAESGLLIVGIGLALGSIMFQIGPKIGRLVEHIIALMS
jgi:hypothetical protein